MNEQKITYQLEMTSREDLTLSERNPPEFQVQRVGIPCPEFCWFMHHAVGVEFRWGGRENWGRDEWTAFVDRPEMEFWVAYVSGTPAGYYELERQEDGSVQIKSFGIRRPFFGQGLGGALLTVVVQRCWEMDANRVWLTTCNHDHPHALENYLARGFKLTNETTGPANPNQVSRMFGRADDFGR